MRIVRHVALAVAIALAGRAPAAQSAKRLAPGAAIEGAAAADERNTYEVALPAGAYGHLTLEHRGVDLVAEVHEPDGSVIRFHDVAGGSGVEQIEVVSTTAGTYQLVLSPYSLNARRGAYVVRYVESRPATDADRLFDRAMRLRTQGRAAFERGDETAAQDLFERALAAAEQARGADDVVTAGFVADLAAAHHEGRHLAKAVPLFERAIARIERVRGPADPSLARPMCELAGAVGETGARQKAEKLAQTGLDLAERTLGPDHLFVALCLMHLGTLRLDAGDIAKAQEYGERALALAERSAGPDSAPTAALLNNLGQAALHKGDLEKADGYFRRSLLLYERLRGADSVQVAVELQNLGIIARQRKDLDRAEAYTLRALDIRQKALGPSHPDVAALLNNLAVLYRNKGDVPKSLATHRRALDVWEAASGPYSSGTLTSLGNIARTYAAMDDLPNAIAFQRRTDSVLEVQRGLNLAVGSERQRLAFVDAMSERTHRTISLNLQLAPDNRDATALAALVVLQRKGRVLDAMTDSTAPLRQHAASDGERRLLDDLADATVRLARFALDPPTDMSAAERQRMLKDLESRKEALEAQISDRSAEFRARSRPVTVDAVSAAIPEDAALVEYIVYRPFDPQADTNQAAYGPPRYAAYVLRHAGGPRAIDLGPVREIDAAVNTLRSALRDPGRSDFDAVARRVGALLLGPLDGFISGAARLLVSPDGALNLIPFEALVDREGRYAVQRHAITYLASGRDLLRMPTSLEPRTAGVIVADPLFGEPEDGDTPVGANGAAPRATQRSVTSGVDLRSVYFAPLTGTAQEARAIKSLFPDARVLSRAEASKAALAAVASPRLLHIATHGFFLENAASSAMQNPLLRSGLALSGANRSRTPTSDGILTALEAATLNLWGTQLVTLSACDTGVGEVRSGEGVYGLRRAFFLAGAQSVVMSLWPVEDAVSRDMMTAYYSGLKQGLGRADALRRAQLAMFARPRHRHPYYWASFIQAGEWTPLHRR